MGKAQKLIESVIDDGRLPADLIRDMIYGPGSRHPLHASQYNRSNAIDEAYPMSATDWGKSPAERQRDLGTFPEWLKTVTRLLNAKGRGSAAQTHKAFLKTQWNDGVLPQDAASELIGEGMREETGGDVSIPENPGDEGPSIASPDGDEADDNMLFISLDTPEDQAEWDDLTRSLSAAGVNYTIERNNDGETVIGWPSNEADAINNILKGLGYSVDDDETPEATFDYYEP